MWRGDGVAKLRLVVLALALCLWLVDGERQTYCGSALPQMLQLVCRGCYNTRDKKYIRSSIDDSYWTWASLPKKEHGEDLDDLEESEHQPPFRDRLRAADMIGDTFRRFTRGVADECCHKQCSMSEVLNYCCDKTRRSFS
ncbi:hypothetical protein ONE63_006157 [Megalurothrips usitatus]|uniref:Insulin-like domain-containing protein n=1 Tax=Megalurothrips usitatus TaxID=439358 RepID=A0AAV7XTI9_9NEOP|nr:hypothetical protein ONE63_006157 [Megalurothrips usitatus]